MTSEGSQGNGKKKRCAKAPPKQIEHLADYMNNHSDLAAGRFTGQQGRANQKRLWNILAEQLNGLGDARDVLGWQKAWTDLKFRIRQKSSSISQAMKSTGNKPVTVTLTDTEKKVLAVIGGNCSLGDPTVEDSMDEPTSNVMFDMENMEFYQNDENVEIITSRYSNNLVITTNHPNDASQDINNGNINNDMEVAHSLLSIADPPPMSPLPGSSNMEAVALPAAPREIPYYSSSGERSRCSSESSVRNTVVTAESETARRVRTLSDSDNTRSGSSSSSSSKRRRTNSEPNAHEHFSRVRDKRHEREQIAVGARNRFAEIQEQNVAHQKDMAKAFALFAENEKQRIELENRRLEYEKERLSVERSRIQQEVANAAVLASVAAAVSQLAQASKKSDS